jgi:uncharacterized membrane protein (UPF0127 family)
MRIAGLLAVAVLVVAGCGAGSSGDDLPDRPASTLTITGEDGSVALAVEIADDDASRARGLMGVEQLPPDQGMAFIWERERQGSFWMKNTLIPLSIAFWDERGRILWIEDMEPCRDDPCPLYGPVQPFLGAVEVNQGWFDKHGVSIGDRVDLEVRAYQ